MKYLHLLEILWILYVLQEAFLDSSLPGLGPSSLCYPVLTCIYFMVVSSSRL